MTTPSDARPTGAITTDGLHGTDALHGTGALNGAATPGLDRNRAGERESIGELLSDITTDLSTLMRQEVELAKAEVKQSATRAGKGAGMLGGAGVSGHFVLLFLSIAVWWGIGDATGHGWSALIVAGIWAVIAAVLAVVGRDQLKAVQGVPRTTQTVKKIPSAVAGNEDQ